MRTSGWTARAALIVTIVAWSSAFTAMRVAVTGFGAGHVALVRFATASAVLALVALRSSTRRRLRAMPPRDVVRIAVIGVIGLGLYNLALATAQVHLAAGTSSVLVATAPIWMAGLGAAIGRDRVGARDAAGLALGFAGVVLVKLGAGPVGGAPAAIAIVLGAAALQAIYNLAQRPLVERHGTLAFICCAVWAATLALAPTLPGLAGELHAAGAAPIVAAIFLGIVPSAIGYTTWAYASPRVSTAEAGAALYLVPPCAMVVAYVWLGERPGASSVAGCALVLVAVAILRGR